MFRILFFLLAMSFVAEGSYLTPKVNSCLNFRKGPNGKKIRCLKSGEKLKVLRRRGSWIKVRHKGRTGYVYSPRGRYTKKYTAHKISHRPKKQKKPAETPTPATGTTIQPSNGDNSLFGDIGIDDPGPKKSSHQAQREAAAGKIGNLTNHCSKKAIRRVKRDAGGAWVRRCAQIFRHTVACVSKKLGNKSCRMDRIACSGSANRYTSGRCKQELNRCGWIRVNAGDPRCHEPGAAHIWARTGTRAGRKHGHIAILDGKLKFRGNHRPIRLNRTPSSWRGKKYCYIPGGDIIKRANSR